MKASVLIEKLHLTPTLVPLLVEGISLNSHQEELMPLYCKMGSGSEIIKGIKGAPEVDVKKL